MRHLLDTASLDRSDITALLALADACVEISGRAIPKVPTLRGRTVASLFFEDSTRTRLSFETAAKRLSADTMTFSVGTSSVKKGESLRDTALTIEAMGVDAVVVRHRSSGAPHRVAGWIDAAVVNAGDGWHDHPTQALLDAYTLTRHLDRTDLDGVRIAVVGDIKHSRVARGDVHAFATLGAEVTLVAPPTLLPPSLEGWPAQVSFHLDEVIGEVDAVYLLRMQNERMTEALIPSLREYSDRFGLTVDRLARLGDDVAIMHPGPMNRGVEICPEAADDPRALIVDQVRNGVAVRMAVLTHLLSGDHRSAPDAAATTVGPNPDQPHVAPEDDVTARPSQIPTEPAR